MASLADLTYGDDELDSADMKPWWEVVVTYCNQLLFSCSFVTLFLIDFREELDSKCVPENLNSTPPIREDFVDTYCHNQLFILTRYPGAGGLMGSVGAYMLCTGWTYPSPMRNAFRVLKKVDKLLDDNRITENDLNRPRSNQHEALTDNKKDAINFASEYLKKYIKFNGKTLLIIYMIAMGLRLGLFAFAVSKIYSTFLCQSDKAIESYYLCDVKLYDETWQVYCTGDILLRGYVFGICIIIIAMIMLVCSGWGTIIAISVCCGCRNNDFILSELSQDERPPISRRTDGQRARGGQSRSTGMGDNTLFLKEFCINSTTVNPALVRLINQIVKSEEK